LKTCNFCCRRKPSFLLRVYPARVSTRKRLRKNRPRQTLTFGRRSWRRSNLAGRTRVRQTSVFGRRRGPAVCRVTDSQRQRGSSVVSTPFFHPRLLLRRLLRFRENVLATRLIPERYTPLPRAFPGDGKSAKNDFTRPDNGRTRLEHSSMFCRVEYRYGTCSVEENKINSLPRTVSGRII